MLWTSASAPLPNMLAFQEKLPVGWSIPDEGTADTTDALSIPRGVPDAARGKEECDEEWARRFADALR